MEDLLWGYSVGAIFNALWMWRAVTPISKGEWMAFIAFALLWPVAMIYVAFLIYRDWKNEKAA